MDNLTTMTLAEEGTAEIQALVEALEALPAATVPAIPPTPAPEAPAEPTLLLPAPAVAAPAPVVQADVPVDGPKPDDLLLNILQTKRAHTSTGDTNFRLWLHAEIKKLGQVPVVAAEGSLIVTVGKKSTTMFSCHIDTVHSVAESNGSRQKLAYDPSFGHVFLYEKTSGCLGGDDGVGIYIMLKMMKAKVKGTYVFHVGEERGGIGSNAILKSRELWLKDFDRCIAFDRAVKHGESPEVIVTQGGKHCASLEFGKQMVYALNEHEFDDPWVISHGGTFTDSRTYSDIIPECINLGCFYLYQHTPREVVDCWGVEKLLAACLKIKWESLKAVRVPEAPKPYTPPPRGGYAGGGSNYFPRSGHKGSDDFDARQFGFLGMEENGFEEQESSKYGRQKCQSGADVGAAAKSMLQGVPKAVPTAPRSTFVELMDYTKEEIVELIDSDPTIAADMLCLLIARYKGMKTQVEALEEFLGV